MKILRVIASMNPASGGPCQGIRNSIPALIELGSFNEVVCMDDPNLDFLVKDSFPIYALGPANNSWAYSPKLIPWLLKNLECYDAVILHGVWLYPGYAVNQVLNRINGKKPSVYIMPHGMLDPYFQVVKTRKIKAIRNWFYWKLIEQKLIHRVDGILFTCEQELMLARNTFRPYQPKEEINIGYGIPEPQPFTPEMAEKFYDLCPEAKGKDFILFLSRIHVKKGVDMLIEAYAQIKKKSFDKNLPLLVIAGPGRESIYGKGVIQQVRQNPSIAGSVLFPGMLTGDAKWGAFYCSEVFILPSHQENFGIAVVESLACKKPVLITNKVNIWQEIEEGKGGMVEGDTIKGIQKLITNWLKLSEEEKESFRKNAIKIFQQNFFIGTAAKKMLSALRN